MASDLWRSARLSYRGVETDDDAFLSTLENNAESYINSSPFLPVPRSQKSAKNFREFLTDRCMLGCIISVLPPEAPNDISAAIPIGILHLTGGSDPAFAHHRHTDLGLIIHRNFQRKGYGTEAILWALRWGFRRANMHRIEIGGFSYNPDALKLYESLGFKVEARKRDFLWHDGKFHDLIDMSMLEDEWRELYDRPQTVAEAKK